jgi:hypothetical protein
MASRASTIIRLAVGGAPGDAAGDLSSSMARSDVVQHVRTPPPPDVTYSTAAVTVPATAIDLPPLAKPPWVPSLAGLRRCQGLLLASDYLRTAA